MVYPLVKSLHSCFYALHIAIKNPDLFRHNAHYSERIHNGESKVIIDNQKKWFEVYKMGLLLQLSLIFLAYSDRSSNRTLEVQALPIDATIDGHVLSGSSILNDPDRFVWGGSVIQGNDNKYQMLSSTWNCGDSIPPISDSWVLHSEIAYAVSDYPDRKFIFQKIILRGAAVEGDSNMGCPNSA